MKPAETIATSADPVPAEASVPVAPHTRQTAAQKRRATPPATLSAPPATAEGFQASTPSPAKADPKAQAVLASAPPAGKAAPVSAPTVLTATKTQAASPAAAVATASTVKPEAVGGAPNPAAPAAAVSAPFQRKAASGSAGRLAYASPEQAPELRTDITGAQASAVTTPQQTPSAPDARTVPVAVAAPVGRNALTSLVARYARENGVPYELAHGVVMVESRYNPKVTGPGGHVGLMQISYPTARSMGFAGTRAGLYDPDANLLYGIKYLAQAYRLAGGDMCGAVSKYQGGHRVVGVTRAGAAYCGKVRKIIAAGVPAIIVADAKP